jgi:hypothetical protein
MSLLQLIFVIVLFDNLEFFNLVFDIEAQRHLFSLHLNVNLKQGRQMAYFQTKNPNLGKFWRVFQWRMLVLFYGYLVFLSQFGILCDCLVCFKIIWHSFSRFGILYQETSGNPDLKQVLPQDVGVKLGSDTGYRSLAILIHYKNLVNWRQAGWPDLANFRLLGGCLLSGRPDWANFRPMDNCLLSAVMCLNTHRRIHYFWATLHFHLLTLPHKLVRLHGAVSISRLECR